MSKTIGWGGLATASIAELFTQEHDTVIAQHRLRAFNNFPPVCSGQAWSGIKRYADNSATVISNPICLITSNSFSCAVSRSISS